LFEPSILHNLSVNFDEEGDVWWVTDVIGNERVLGVVQKLFFIMLNH
jgi:hypothetical protein